MSFSQYNDKLLEERDVGAMSRLNSPTNCRNKDTPNIRAVSIFRKVVGPMGRLNSLTSCLNKDMLDQRTVSDNPKSCWNKEMSDIRAVSIVQQILGIKRCRTNEPF